MKLGGTIAAVTSPRGPGGRGVLRVSGPKAWEIVAATARAGASPSSRSQRGFFRGRFDDGRGEQPLLLLWMPGPRSFTREDVAEFHLPGSPPLIDVALARLLSLGARAAGPGEFTRRAFENGRIDLTRAEGLLELVQARGEAERRSASALLFGGLANRLAPLREGLDTLRSLAEASLDFDETDTGHVPTPELEAGARRLLQGLHEAAGWEARRIARSDLPRVVLLGQPNAGKSTLFNALVPGASAIVSSLPGTTRDVLHGVWETPAGPVRLVDTAGIDAQATGPDATAQTMARAWRADSDLRLWLVDAARSQEPGLAAERQECGGDAPVILVWSRCDLAEAGPSAPELVGTVASSLHLCAPSGAGLAELGDLVAGALGLAGAPGPATERMEREIGVRHRVALEQSAARLQEGLDAWLMGLPLDLFAEALRAAGGELDTISGSTTPEDVLDRIFAAFCLGK